MGLTDVRVHIMQQNARQILDVVRGTFPGLSFNGTSYDNGCTSLKSDGEALDCLWSRAAKSLDSAETLRAFTEVC